MANLITMDELVSLLRSALVNLFDSSYLETHPLADLLVPGRPSPGRTRAQEVRNKLLDALERLSPNNKLEAQTRASRPYQVLYLQYVDGFSFEEIAKRLIVGERQLRRDSRRAMEALAAILWDEYIAPNGAESALRQPGNGVHDALQNELDRLRHNKERVALDEICHGLAATLRGMARRVTVVCCTDSGLESPVVFGSEAIIRESLLGLLTYVLGVYQEGTLTLATYEQADTALVVCTFEGIEYDAERHVVLQAESGGHVKFGQELAAAEGGQLQLVQGAHGVTISLELPTGLRTVLVIEDNQTVVSLYERYLAQRSYRVVWANNRDQALLLAQRLRPSLIILDVMMPDCSGWELLQNLTAMPETRNAGVIVCSVVDNPELAYSLGAKRFIRKPVRQAELLAALDDVQSDSDGDAVDDPESLAND